MINAIAFSMAGALRRLHAHAERVVAARIVGKYCSGKDVIVVDVITGKRVRK